MKLLTAEIRKRLPALYSQEHLADPTVHAKFYQPWGRWTWLVTEGGYITYDADGNEQHHSLSGPQPDDSTVLFFGLVKGDETEWGYFRLEELAAIRGPGGLGIERAMHFEPRPLSEVRR